jgi:hypothetical protein
VTGEDRNQLEYELNSLEKRRKEIERKIEKTAGLYDKFKSFEELFLKEIIEDGIDTVVEGACGINCFPSIDILASGFSGAYIVIDSNFPYPSSYRKFISDDFSKPNPFLVEQTNYDHRLVRIRGNAMDEKLVKSVLTNYKSQKSCFVSNIAFSNNLFYSSDVDEVKEYVQIVDRLPFAKQIHIHPDAFSIIVSPENALHLREFRQILLGTKAVVIDYLENKWAGHFTNSVLEMFEALKWEFEVLYQDVLILRRQI